MFGFSEGLGFRKAKVLKPGLDIPEECFDSISVLLLRDIVPEWDFARGIEVVDRMMYCLDCSEYIGQVIFQDAFAVRWHARRWHARRWRRHEVHGFNFDPQRSEEHTSELQ